MIRKLGMQRALAERIYKISCACKWKRSSRYGKRGGLKQMATEEEKCLIGLALKDLGMKEAMQLIDDKSVLRKI